MSAVAQQSIARAPEQTAIDLEKMPVERVLAQLAVKPERGLSSAEARDVVAPTVPMPASVAPAFAVTAEFAISGGGAGVLLRRSALISTK
jgi:hypothetical protein